MNYLGHALMAHDRSRDFRFGAIAPDLAGMNGMRAASSSPSDIARVKLPSQRNIRRMLRGINFHRQTDVAFDGLSSLDELKDIFYTQVAPEYLDTTSHQALLVAGAGTDMLVDGEVQRHWPAINALYSLTLQNVTYEVVAKALNTTSKPKKHAFFDRIKERSQKPVPDYQDPELVASMLAWRVNNGRFKHIRIEPSETPAIARAMEAYQPQIRTYGFGLIRATAEIMGCALPEPML